MPSSDAWSCPICLGSFERPVVVSCCGQSFCRACLDDALRQADACPMCRSPLLSGPFSVTSNRALADALNALNPPSPRRPTSGTNAVTSFVDAAERKLMSAARNSESRVQISVLTAADSESDAALIQDGEEMSRQVQGIFGWMQRLAWCRIQNCRRPGRCLSTRSAELRRRWRQWRLWCRVNWGSLQCMFYVVLFFVFVFFLRVQEEEFGDESIKRLRRPN